MLTGRCCPSLRKSLGGRPNSFRAGAGFGCWPGFQTLTTLAGELPRGLDTPVEVGLEHDSLATSAAINIYPTTAVWPGRDDGTDCRATTVQVTGEPDHPDADRYYRHPRTGHPDWEDPR